MTFLKNLAKYILAMLFGLLLSAMIIEVVLRLYNPFEFRVRGDKIVLQKNITRVIVNHKIPKLDEKIIQRRNSLGFRGEEPPQGLDFVSGKHLTIIAVGGSTTECLYLSDGKTWPDDLAKLLKERIDKVWVNNAGFDGYSTFGNLVLMRDYIADLHPKIVLFLIGINDIGQNMPNVHTDAKVMEDGKFRAEESAGWCFSSPSCFVNTLAYHSEFANLALNLYRYLKAGSVMVSQVDIVKTIKGGVGHIQLNPQDLSQLIISEDRIQQVLEAHNQGYIPQYEERVKSLVEISRNNGIEPILITQPMLYGVGKDDITGIDLETVQIHNTNGLLEWKILELYNDVLRKVGKEKGLLVIDLAQKMPHSSLYYYDFMHYTNEGAVKVAKIIYEDLYPFVIDRGFTH